MTYIVYADVLFGYHVLIHLALYFMISAIIWQTIRITRTILWAILTAVLSTGIFLLTVNLSTILYYLLYAITYFIMTYFFTKSCSFKNSMLVCAGITFLCCVWLAGMMELFCFRGHSKLFFYIGFLPACIGSVFLCRKVRKILLKKHILKESGFQIRLSFLHTSIQTYGFVDTGNRLQNPYTKEPVIIVDYRLLKFLLPKSSYQNLEYYHKTGIFPYEKQKEQGVFFCFPLPYHTIRDNFALMPAFILPELTFCQTGRTYRNVTAGISKESIMDKDHYRVLLHEGLNPNREENSND